MSVGSLLAAAIQNGLSAWIYVGAAAILVLILWAVGAAAEGAVQGAWGRVGDFVVGTDGRTSTSKLSAALWTLALIYALVAMLLDGRVFGGSLREEYLFLLGGPYAAAIGAKAITTSKVQSGTVTKDQAAPSRSKRQHLADVVSDDDGQLDLGDAQYFAFTLVALLYFIVAFVQDPSSLPDIPDTLVGLSTASAAAYLGKKGAYRDANSGVHISSVSPSRIILGETSSLSLAGSGFMPEDESKKADGGTPNSSPKKDLKAVKLDGVELEASEWEATSVSAALVGWAAKGLRENQQAELVVRNYRGRESDPFKLRVEEAS